MNKRKKFVLDTNVILHDYKSIYNFDEHDIIIPIIVLEELDKFKKGSDLINFHAREFMRELDRLTGDHLFTESEGVSLGKNHGTLYIETGKEFSKEMQKSFSENTADHRILAVAEFAKKDLPDFEVTLVTQDINLRMKAKSLGLHSQDYETGKVTDIDHLNRGVSVYENVVDELINRLYKEYDGVRVDEFPFAGELIANQYCIIKGNRSSALGYYNKTNSTLERVEKQTAYGIVPRNAEQTFAIHSLITPEIQLVALTGKAGTGKTLLALASALFQRRDFHQIYLARPIVPLANKDIGFLPGEVQDKIGPYMQPLFDNLSVIKHRFPSHTTEYKRIEDMVKNEKLLITPLAYIRGRSLSNIYFIVDEAQNLTPHEVKTIITRAGEGTKMVFTGDIHQIDSPYLDTKSNGLSYLADKMQGQEVFAHVNLVKGERSFLAELASDLL